MSDPAMALAPSVTNGAAMAPAPSVASGAAMTLTPSVTSGAAMALAPSVTSGAAMNAELFINREQSWLEFNNRVLEEAQDKNNPLFERLKFLAICFSNLDEFFMVRISDVLTLAEVKGAGRDPSGLTPDEQLIEISKKTHKMVTDLYNTFTRSIVRGLKTEGIEFVDVPRLTTDERVAVERYFNTTLFPVLTPMAIDRSRRFPFISNCSLNIILELDGHERHAVIQVPPVVPRFFELQPGKRFILIEDIIKTYANRLFEGNRVLYAHCFRITRNSELDFDEEDADDLLNEIEKSVKKRKRGEPVRLEIEKNANKKLSKFLQKTLDLDAGDVYEINGPLDLTFLMPFALKGPARLMNLPIAPSRAPAFEGWEQPENVWNAIKSGDLLVHHPFESFDPVTRFVHAAACDPGVLAIKQTLYRVSGKSPIVASLIHAAENGKQVTVLVELKARFDEENNIIWAKKLEQAGCHVVYGLVGYKTHCKMILAVRREEDGIHRYVHLGTGNYNDSTARIYTDLGYFTCKENFGADVSALFNVLTGYSNYIRFNKLVTAPASLRNSFIALIDEEIQNASLGMPAGITAKMNALVDPEIITALYRASQAGVKINLIVRGICCLRPGLPGVSENIRVVSIVDRYLEHSRIYKFENGGEPRVFLSSADWMQRNLDRRVEIAFPIEDESLKERIGRILDLQLSDTVKLRELAADGSYHRARRRTRDAVHSQLALHENP